MQSDTGRLFNAIVILGVSLTAACSSGSSDPTPAPNATAGNSGNTGNPNYVVNADAAVSDSGWTGW